MRVAGCSQVPLWQPEGKDEQPAIYKDDEKKQLALRGDRAEFTELKDVKWTSFKADVEGLWGELSAGPDGSLLFKLPEKDVELDTADCTLLEKGTTKALSADKDAKKRLRVVKSADGQQDIYRLTLMEVRSGLKWKADGSPNLEEKEGEEFSVLEVLNDSKAIMNDGALMLQKQPEKPALDEIDNALKAGNAWSGWSGENSAQLVEQVVFVDRSKPNTIFVGEAWRVDWSVESPKLEKPMYGPHASLPPPYRKPASHHPQ